MTLIQLCVPRDAAVETTSPGIVIDRCLPDSAAGPRHLQKITAGFLRDHRDDSIAADVAAVTTAVSPRGIEMIRPLLDCLHPEESLMLHQEAAIPAALLELFPETLWGFLHRPLPADICCLPLPVLRQAAPSDAVCSLWLTHGAFSASVAEPPCVERFPELGPGKPVVSASLLEDALQKVEVLSELEEYDARCFISGVLLLWDQLDASHQISQSMEGEGSPQTADYWHGIMHRREPDAGNAAYWFRRVGRHPAMEHLCQNLTPWLDGMGFQAENAGALPASLQQPDWDSQAFIRDCSQVGQSSASTQSGLLRAVQYLEILNLLAWPWR